MITRQEIFNIVDLFTSQSTINFYENIFDNLDLSFIPEFIESKRGPKGYSRHALTRAFVVMNCEHFREITLLCDFLNTNLKIAQLCGFDITKPLPSYSVYQRFIHDIDNNLLKEIMKSQVNELIKLDAIDNSIVSVDSTPIKANTKYNNPKCFSKNKFSNEKPPKSDKDCKLGVHTANNEDSKCNNYTLEEQAIINILKANPTTTQDEIAKQISKSLRTVKTRMMEMQEKGLIERKNGRRNAEWIVKQ